jgi:hypothetical protein
MAILSKIPLSPNNFQSFSKNVMCRHLWVALSLTLFYFQFRIPIEPDDQNHLEKIYFVMVDKTMTILWEKAEIVFGYVDEFTFLRVESSLAVFLGITR